MSVLVLGGDRRVLGVRGDALAVMIGGDVVATRAPEQVDEVYVFGDGQVSPRARHLCLLRGIDVVFFTARGSYLGRMGSRESAAGERRLAHLGAASDPSRRVRVAAAVVVGKIANQETHLRRVQRRVRRPEIGDALGVLQGARDRALAEVSLDALRGHEGLAAREYFGVLRHACTNPLFTFAGRNRRPPRDPINAALSFAYAMLVRRVESAVRGAGLDVYVGFLHEATRGNPACALDLAEEWRPVVDAMVFGLFNRRELAPEDFRVPGAVFGEEAPDPDAVHLAEVGRDVVLRTWFKRLREPLYVAGADARLELGDAIAWQAAHLARVCEGKEETYVAARWT